MLLLILTVITVIYIAWTLLSRKTHSEHAATPTSNSFIDEMVNRNKDTAVIFGSESGTSEYFSHSIKAGLQRIGLSPVVIDPSQWDIECLLEFAKIENFLAIFIVATYGEGDPTSNAQSLHEFLNEDGDDLESMKYAVFGCGNSSYTYYNEMGKFVHRRLELRGATPIFDLKLGDSNDNIEEDFIEWKSSLLSRIFDLFDLHNVDIEIKRNYALIEHTNGEYYKGQISTNNEMGIFDINNPFMGKMVSVSRLGKDGARVFYRAEFDLTGSGLRYSAGDHIGIYPRNSPVIVDRIGDLLGTDLDLIFSLESIDEDSKSNHPFPCPTTYRIALLHYLDICTHLRRDILQFLLPYVSDSKDKQFFSSLIENATNDSNKGVYDEWVVSARRSILDFLEEIPSLRPPLDLVCEVLPRLRPRMYSISSSPRTSSTVVSITAVLVDYIALSGRRIKGVATSFMWDCVKKDVPLFIRRSTFKLPSRPSLPIIMVGPGTGIAPFMGFLRERQARRLNNGRVAKSILFYGCRYKNEDYLYEDELGYMVKDGTLTELHVAFSRDQVNKIYVQHLIWENRDTLWGLINGEKAHLYICGDAKYMARDVNDKFVRIASHCGEMSEEEAKQYIMRLRQSRRYLCDVWS